MSALTVDKAIFKKDFTTANGTMYVFTITGVMDGEDTLGEMTFKSKDNAPKPGDVLEVTYTDDPQWGRKFKKAQQNGFGGNKGGFTPRPQDPEVQKMIVRQNALSNAVTFLSSLATLEKKPDQLTTDNVLLIAGKFAKFSLGEIEAKAPVVDELPKSTIDDGPGYNEDEE